MTNINEICYKIGNDATTEYDHFESAIKIPFHVSTFQSYFQNKIRKCTTIFITFPIFPQHKYIAWRPQSLAHRFSQRRISCVFLW